MNEPSDFGIFLKKKRNAAKLTQDDLAAAITKSGQYISNIEKGKNNAPPNNSDIEALIQALKLTENDARLFREKAAADRSRLPKEQMDYLFSHRNLINIIDYGIKHNISDKQWKQILSEISGGTKQ